MRNRMKHRLFAGVLLVSFWGVSSINAATLRHRYNFIDAVSDVEGFADGSLQSGALVRGGALQLDGLGAYAELPAGIVSGLDSFTIETWVTDHGSATWARIFDFGTGTDDYMFLCPQADSGVLRAAITVTSYNDEKQLEWAGTRLPLGLPVQVAWTYDAAAQTGTLYVNGFEVDRNSSVDVAPSDLGYTTQNWLGRSQWPDPYFNGSIDEFRIYDGAMTPGEVLASYTAGADVVEGPVTIIQDPVSQSVEEARPVTFEIGYHGSQPVHVQWYRNSVLIPDATNATYSIAEVALSDHNNVFHAIVSNLHETISYSDMSAPATLSVTADTTPPTLDRVVSLFPDGVRLHFSESVTAASGLNIANYSIGGLTLMGASFGDDTSTVFLTTGIQTLETSYTLHVANIQDRSSAANTIITTQTTFIASSLPTEDVGTPELSGSATGVPGGVDFMAAGSGIGGTADQFSFGYKLYTGDFDVKVRIDGMDYTSQWARAGLMARDGLDADALFAGIFTLSGPAGCQFLSRSSVGGDTSTEGYFPSSYPGTWLRLRRTGDLFEGFAGIDGHTWELVGSKTISMSSSIEVGYAVTSSDVSSYTTARFRDESPGGGTVVSCIALPFEPLGPSSRRGTMVISEIMVDTPSGWGGTNSLEFIEMYNTGLITEDLSGHRFSGEIDYIFPAGTTLAPGEFIVIAKDPSAAESFYGVSCLGPYDGKLANGGGTLRFRNELDGILLEVEYDNRAPWPVAAFGTGHSLVLSHPSYGEGDPRAWSASDLIGGSPGSTDGYSFDPSRGVVINEYLAHTDLPQVDYVELFNTGASAVDLSGFWLSDEAGTKKFRIADGTTIPSRGFLVYDQNELGFALSADGEAIYLVHSNQTRVVDAVTFRGQANGVSEGRYPDGAPGFQELGTVTEGSANAPPLVRSVVINEIMYHPISESNNDEYIELHNRSGSPVDISSWRLQGGISYQFPDGTQIPALGYIVVAENATNLIAKYTQLNSSNTYGNYRGTLGNGGDTVRLAMPEDLISTNGSGLVVTNIYYIPVDEVTYLDGGRWGQWSDGGGSSLELIDPDSDNREPANWADSDETEKAPWTTIDVTKELGNGQGTPDRIELYMQGAGETLLDDVEFENNGGGNWLSNGNFSSGDNGWGFGGVVRNSYIESGAGTGGSAALRLVSSARGDNSCNNADHVLDSTATTGGSNTGTIRAQVRWLKGSRYIMIRLRGQYMEASQSIDVPVNCGTPGQANSQLVSNAGPAIYDVMHSPVLPVAGESIVVSARAVDPDGVSSMRLYFRTDLSTSYASTLMLDNGTSGDAVAGDGIYTASISGKSGGTLVAFYVSATDGSATTTFPAAVPEQECLVQWGETGFSGGLGTYRLWVTADNISFWGSREQNANDTMDATFVYGDYRVVYNVGTMYSGSPFHTPAYNGPLGSFACDYEINFQTGERFLGAEPFVLSGEGFDTGNFWYDTSTQVDLTSTWIGRKLGQQYNYRRHVHMVLNGNERGMIYLDSQQPNSDMLDQYFPNDDEGDLRKIEDWFEFDTDDEDFSYITATVERFNDYMGDVDAKRYRWNWRPRTTKNHDRWFAFTNLIAAVNDTGSADYESRVRSWMDVRNFVRPVAVNRICGNWDSYGYERGKNMYAYKPDDEGWRLLPWDIELALGNGSRGTNDPIDDFHDPALSSLIKDTPAFYREYLMALQEAADTVLVASEVNSILDERYTNLVAHGVPVSSPASMKSWIAGRRSYLQGILPAASFAVDGSSSFSVSTNSVILTGTAPLQVAEIRVNGIPYPVEWMSTTAWSLTVPLTAGLNSLTVTGADRFGVLVSGASEALSVTFTGSELDPEDVVVISEIHPSPEDRNLQFLEIFNTSATHVFDLSGWRINGIGYTFPAGSVIGVGEYIVLVEDPYRFADQYDDVPIFDVYGGSLDPQGETLTLFRPGGLPGEEIVVDRVRYEASAPWATLAGGSSLQLIDASRDNARSANWASAAGNASSTPVNVVAIDHTWKYYQSGYPGADWADAGFNDHPWPSGDALLYVEDSSLPAPKNTGLTIGETTYYFRSTFLYSGNLSGATLKLNTVVDDGLVLYLNGTEIFRLGMDAGTLTHETSANRVIGDAQYEGVFTIPASALVSGQNVLAAEVHQQAPDSSDVVFGITLDVVGDDAASVTPGTTNSMAETLPAFPEIWLNELQADNVTGPVDNFGDNDPWIELYNAGSSALSLDGYYLTDDYANPTQWAFPAAASIPAGGYLVVWCDGEPGEWVPGFLHTDFALSSSAGRVGLVRISDSAPQMVDYLNYTNLPSNYSYGDVPDGQPFYRFDLFYATPSTTNNGASAPIEVSINEWMVDNDGTLSDPADGNYEDWFEIYNPGTNTVDLGGYFLTDDLANPFKYAVPNNGHYTIEAGGYLLVWADGEPGQNATNLPDLHADFSLSKGGESIGIFAADGTAIDVVTFGVQATDVSEGRVPDGAAGIYTQGTPTPRASNYVENSEPVLDEISDIVVTLGQTVQFFAAATDDNVPEQQLTFSLANAPAGASIQPATGMFNWIPDSAPSTNTLAVVVTDNGTPGLSDMEWFTITVVPPPVIHDLSISGSDISFSWSSVSGQQYRVYYKDELVEVYWNPLSDILFGTGGVMSYAISFTNSPQRFFNLGLDPVEE